jgi:hypothetical protein
MPPVLSPSKSNRFVAYARGSDTICARLCWADIVSSHIGHVLFKYGKMVECLFRWDGINVMLHAYCLCLSVSCVCVYARQKLARRNHAKNQNAEEAASPSPVINHHNLKPFPLSSLSLATRMVVQSIALASCIAMVSFFAIL